LPDYPITQLPNLSEEGPPVADPRKCAEKIVPNPSEGWDEVAGKGRPINSLTSQLEVRVKNGTSVAGRPEGRSAAPVDLLFVKITKHPIHKFRSFVDKATE
jgi:hypothetical protein